jgi:hypothetical protein
MQCEICDTEFRGDRCSCGWQPRTAKGLPPAAPEPKGNESVTHRRWAFCEWTTPQGTCQAPTGTLGLNVTELSPPKLCAYHRERQGISLKDVRLSERQVFDEWLAQFPAGTTYQPFPGIWDKDPDLLWLLITGAVPFAEAAGRLLGRKIDLRKAQHDVERGAA